jgi:acetyl esterase/lipase
MKYLFLLLLLTQTACFHASQRTKNVAYVSETAPDFDSERHRLDVFAPKRKTGTPRPVVVFIHGGSWNSGSKNLYWFIGRRLAKKGVVAVTINYRLAPAVRVPAMADDCARALRWVTEHAAEYGGDPARIFTMGHSAGGGLAALLATDDALLARHGLPKNSVQGAILDDAAGLDMYDYLLKKEYPNDEQYLVPFGTDPAVWRAVSPMYHVGSGTPPMRVYVGERTYPSIRDSSRRFVKRLEEASVPHTSTVIPRKTHVGMVAQLFWGSNRLYDDIERFVKPAQR